MRKWEIFPKHSFFTVFQNFSLVAKYSWAFLRISQKFPQNYSEFLQKFSQIFCRFWDIDEEVGDFSEALIFYSFSDFLNIS